MSVSKPAEGEGFTTPKNVQFPASIMLATVKSEITGLGCKKQSN